MVKKIENSRSKNYTKNIVFAGAIFFLSAHLCAEVSTSATLFLGRAFSANSAREMMMSAPCNENNNNNFNSYFSASAVYQRSFEQSHTQGIGAYPFWSQTNAMTVGTANGKSSLDAYQFGLGDVATVGVITLNPVVYQAGTDFMFYVSNKKNESGFFAKIKSAINVMSIDPSLQEINPAAAVAYPDGALSALFTGETPAPSTSITQAFAGVKGSQQAENDFRPMSKGLIDGVQSTGAHLSDIEMTFGYNLVCPKTDNSISIGARLTAPAGNKPESIYVLEPVTGRGGYWGIGAYLAAHFSIWDQDDNNFAVNFMSNGIHLCEQNVMRQYDLTENGNGSKYLLVADYRNSIYQNSVQNLVNVSTLASQSSFRFEGDASLAVSYNYENISVDIGYNVWGRTKENLTINESFDVQRYAIIGRQLVANDLCQPTATISSALDSDDVNAVDATNPDNRISGNDAFNTTMAGQYSAVTSKMFTKIGYTWKESSCCPHVNLLGEFEFSNISNNALPQWGIALAGGVSF